MRREFTTGRQPFPPPICGPNLYCHHPIEIYPLTSNICMHSWYRGIHKYRFTDILQIPYVSFAIFSYINFHMLSLIHFVQYCLVYLQRFPFVRILRTISFTFVRLTFFFGSVFPFFAFLFSVSNSSLHQFYQY